MNRWHACRTEARYFSWPDFWRHRLGECSKPLDTDSRHAMEQALARALRQSERRALLRSDPNA